MGASSDRRAFALGVVLALLVTLPVVAPLAAAEPTVVQGATTPTPPEPAAVPWTDDRPVTEHPEGPLQPFARTEPPRLTASNEHDETRHRVTLVTGETVTVSRHGEEVAIESVEGGSVGLVQTNDEAYLIPEAVDLSTYDRSLFSVESLLAYESDGRGIPVLIDSNASLDPVNASALRNVRYLRSAGVIAAEVDPAEAPGTIPRLVADGTVERVSIDRRFDGPAEPVRANAGDVTRYGYTGEGVTVAVLDTGIDATHPDLEGSVVERFDLVDGEGRGGDDGANEDRPLDPNGHGTIVAGVLAGSGIESEGRVHRGVAPDAGLVDVRVMDERGVAQASTIIAGIERAVDADVDVVLMSIGSSIDGSEAVAASVEWATERGVIVVAAAGNEGKPRSIGAPGRPDDVITVGATDGRGRVASYSSRGPTLDGRLKPDLVAPGQGIVGPRADGAGRPAIDDAGRYTRTSGTSVATPRVAAAVALLLESDPGLSSRAIENRLASTARPIDDVDAYAQGSGEVDVERALDPDVVATDAVVDFGLVEAAEIRNRTIALVNHDDRPHDLSFSTGVRNADLGRPANETAWLNRTALRLAPGERAAIELTIDGNTTSGAHAGSVRYAVDGEARSVAFGFVRGGRVTVEKLPLTRGDRVDGDELWVLTEEGTHDELLSFANGTASFVAGGGTYVLWSTGYDEASGTTVFLSERRVIDGPTNVVLNERRTAPVGVDVGPIVERYGQLANRSVIVSMSTEYAGGLARRSVADGNVDGRAVRVSPDPDLDVATTFLLSTGGRSESFDVADVFHLAYGLRGVHGQSVVEVTPDRLETTAYRYHRTTVDETYLVRDRARFDDVWNQRSSRWFDLEGRTTQRLHRLRGAASYQRVLEGEGWATHGGTRWAPGRNVDVLAHPLLGLAEVRYVGNRSVAVAGTPFSDGSGTDFDPAGEHTLSAWIDGEVVSESHLFDGSGSLGALAVDPGQNLTVRLVGNNSGGHLSTRTLTEVTLPVYAPPETRRIAVEDRPPTVTNLSVAHADDVNAAPPGSVTLGIDVDLVGVAVDPAVWYSTASPSAAPWRNESGWSRADVEREGDRLLATMDVEGAGERVSVAVELRDIWGRRTRTMTIDGVHVGRAPNTSTSTIVGQFVAADGTPAANDTIVLRRVDGERIRYVETDRRGRFEVEVPRAHRYDLLYVRGAPWIPRTPVDDDRPAWLPLGRVDAASDVDLGVRSLPPARQLSVTVTDERGEPVEGATVRLAQRRGNVSTGDVMVTTRRGTARSRGIEAPGIALAGTVQLVVTPPEDDLYPDQEHRYTVRLDRPRTVNVTLETAPPVAVLTAFGSFEAGDVVFLHAWRSEVPAGVAEYRWDVDGDGEADRVTERPIVRYVPDEDTQRPTVTVVDRAGKTDSSTLALSIGSG